MAMGNSRWNRSTVAQAGAFVVLSTVLLTASFLGIVALVTGAVNGLNTRLPFYVLSMAIAFVGAIITFEEEFRGGTQILQLSVIGAIATFVFVTLGGEGVAYLVENPEQVVASHLLFYILAAGLIGTGIGYWAVQHWAELTQRNTEL